MVCGKSTRTRWRTTPRHTRGFPSRNTNADAHLYRVARKRCGGRRESHSINTPRCLLRLHPQERLSLSPLSLSLLSTSHRCPSSSLSPSVSLSLVSRCVFVALDPLPFARPPRGKGTTEETLARSFPFSRSSPSRFALDERGLRRKYSAAQQDFSSREITNIHHPVAAGDCREGFNGEFGRRRVREAFGFRGVAMRSVVNDEIKP